MAYCTQADIQARIGTQQLAELTNDTANSGAVDTTVLNTLLDEVTAEMDAALNSIYTLPLVLTDTKTSNLLQSVSVNLFVYRLFSRRPGFLEVPQSYKDLYESAMKILEKIGNQSIKLPGETVSSPEVDYVYLDKKFDFDNEDSCTQYF